MRRRGMAAAAALLQLQCHVWMLPQSESGTGARRTQETAGCTRALHYLAGRKPLLPYLCSLARVDPSFCTPKKKEP